MRRLRLTLATSTAALLLGLTAPAWAGPPAHPSPHHPAPHHPSPHPTLSWQDRPTGSTARLRGLAAVSRSVAWVSGSAGTVLRTRDAGRTWQDVSPGGDAAGLDLRDIEAFDDRRAVALSAGVGADSRIYRTTDGGATWTAAFTNADDAAFYDCLGFWDERDGLAVADPVDGRFRILATHDGGASWSVQDPSGMPDALAGEFAFAASGTCLVTGGRHDAWLATGGGEHSRVLHTRDGGRTWTAATTPVATSASGGIYSLAAGRGRLLAVGGDYLHEDVRAHTSARSRDDGRTWADGGDLGGYRSGSAWLPDGPHRHLDHPTPGHHGDHGDRDGAALAVGPTGTDVTWDGGRTWAAVDDGSLDGVACTRDGACWGSGEKGRVAVLAGLPRHQGHHGPHDGPHDGHGPGRSARP